MCCNYWGCVQGTGKRSEVQLLNEAESLGIRLTANASREVTAIYAQCLSKHVPKGKLDITLNHLSIHFSKPSIIFVHGLMLKSLLSVNI